MDNAAETILPEPQLRLAGSLKGICFACDFCGERTATRVVGRRNVCCDECMRADPALAQKFEEALRFAKERRAEGPLSAIAQEQTEINAANGWAALTPADWTDQNLVLSKLAMVASEVGEAVEAVRINDFENFAEEAADIILRVVTLAVQLGVAIDHAVAAKMQRNRARPHRHGNKRC